MRRLLLIVPVALLVSLASCASNGPDRMAADAKAGWVMDFSAEKSDLVSTGRNPYFVLEPGYVLVLEDRGERLTITVKDETKLIDGVECRVVEEHETKGGKVVENSNNYFAIGQRSQNVYYFGEDVGGAWLSGEKGAKFGLMMPAQPQAGIKHYQELAPGVAMDRAEVLSVTETVKTPAGEFRNCVKVRETSAIEKAAPEYKYYAPGVGLVQEESLKLVKYGKTVAPAK